MPLRMAVDASSARAGGGVTYARELLPELAHLPSVDLVACLLPIGLDEATANSLRATGAAIQYASRRMDASRARWQRLVRNRQTEVVYTPTEISFASYQCLQVNALRSPIYEPSTVRGYPVSRRARFLVKRSMATRSARRADGFIAVSEFAAQLGHMRLRVPRDDIRVVYHGSRAPQGSHDSRGPVKRWLFVSNISRYKNVMTLLRSTANVPDPDFRLRIVGGFDTARDRREVEHMVDDLADARVEMVGQVAPDAVAQWFEWADGLVWPSYAETFGHPLAAAVQRGMAVVACDAASNREIAGDAAVYFSPPDDAERLGQQLRVATEGTQSFGPPPRTYSWQKCAADTAEALRSLF